MGAPLVSIVIPVLRDTRELEGLLKTLESQRPDLEGSGAAPGGFEVIVVNGDPTDPTLEKAQPRFPDVHWTTCPPGRGRQMNAGAQLATGRWLLFLHADTRPVSGWVEEIRRVDQDPAILGGAFRFTLRSAARVARLLERGVAWRVRWLGLPYGDQGLFVRRDIFDALEGYRSLAIMEDVDLGHRLRRRGRLLYSQVPVSVSTRRWERDGWVRRTIANLLLLGLYYAGVSPDRLARVYYGRTPEKPAAAPRQRRPSGDKSITTGSRRVVVIIPALNEEEAIGSVLAEIPAFVSSVTVVDNGSTDATADQARAAGALVVTEPVPGYGRACLTGLRGAADADIIVFLDADRSDFPEEMTELVSPILAGQADLVMGARGGAGRPLTARGGTALCVGLINGLWRTRYRDLGPFRAIRRAALDQLQMRDQTWGWTIEMQVKAAEAGLRTLEVPIRQRPRIGQSKISGTIRGTVRAGARMLSTIWSLWRTRRARGAAHA